MEQETENVERPDESLSYTMLGAIVGLVLGVIITSVLFQNFYIGAVVGLVLGVIAGMAVEKKRKK